MTTTTHTSTATDLKDIDRAAVAAVPARMMEIWAKHDAAEFAELFAEDGTLILPGVYKHGRTEIREFMATAFAGPYQGSRVTGQPIDMKLLAPGAVALITTGGVVADGEAELSAAAAIRASWILVQQNGQWRLALYQNCPRDPRP